jgi:hypothetical protein
LTKIDWTKPIEAIDGTPAEFIGWTTGGRAKVKIAGNLYTWWYDDEGKHISGNKIDIRNVVMPKERPALPAEWAVQRAIERNNAVLGGAGLGGLTAKAVLAAAAVVVGTTGSILTYYWLIAHARDIERYEQPPASPELIAARERFAKKFAKNGTQYKATFEGQYDSNVEIKAFLAGVEWGRANEK